MTALHTQKYVFNTNSYGESHLIVLMGGLDIEVTGLKVIGDWLEDSGWEEDLVQAKLASLGKADSFLKTSNVTKSEMPTKLLLAP